MLLCYILLNITLAICNQANDMNNSMQNLLNKFGVHSNKHTANPTGKNSNINKLRDDIYKNLYESVLQHESEQIDYNKNATLSENKPQPANENKEILANDDLFEHFIDENTLTNHQEFMNYAFRGSNEPACPDPNPCLVRGCTDLIDDDQKQMLKDIRTCDMIQKCKDKKQQAEYSHERFSSENYEYVSEEVDTYKSDDGFMNNEALNYQNFIVMPDITCFVDNMVDNFNLINERVGDIVDSRLCNFFDTLDEYSENLYQFTLQIFNEAMCSLKNITNVMFGEYHTSVILSLKDRIICKNEKDKDHHNRMVINIDEILEKTNLEIIKIMNNVSYDSQKIYEYIRTNSGETYTQLIQMLADRNISSYSKPMYLCNAKEKIQSIFNTGDKKCTKRLATVVDCMKDKMQDEISKAASKSSSASSRRMYESVKDDVSRHSNEFFCSTQRSMRDQSKRNIQRVAYEFEKKKNRIDTSINEIYAFLGKNTKACRDVSDDMSCH